MVSRFQQGWQDPLYKVSYVRATSPKEEFSYMRVQVHNLLFKHFDFPFSVTLDSTNSFFAGEKIFLTARFLAWLSSGRPLAFHLLSSITFSWTFPTKPLGLKSKEGIQALREACASLFLD